MATDLRPSAFKQFRASMAIAFCAMLLVVPSAAAQQGDDDTNAIDDTPHLTIIGTAHSEVVPDLAQISLGVTTERPSAVDASAETARIATAIVDAAKAQGVEARDMQTQAILLNQVYDDLHDNNGHYIGRRPRGFSASVTVAIRTRALDKAGALAQSLIEKGATSFNGIGFSVEHPEPIQDRLLAEAVRDARHKAELSVGALGIKLGRVLLIEKPQAPGGAPFATYSRMTAMPAPASPAIPVQAGTQTMEADTAVTWALEQ
jgi:uncharacterized protein